jgi:CheY-like chemotaxis protein
LSIAYDGYLALGRLLRENFDFLITTNETQGMNGIALIAAVRLSRTINKSIPSLVITSGQSIRTGRGIDPDFVIVRNTGFAENLTAVIHQIAANGG